MAFLTHRYLKTYPHYPLEIDRTNPITKGLVYANAGKNYGYTKSRGLRTYVDRQEYYTGGTIANYSTNIDTATNTIIGKVYAASLYPWGTFNNGYYVSAADNMSLGIGFSNTNNLSAICRRNSDAVTNFKAITFPYNAVLCATGTIGTGGTAYENGISIGSITNNGTYLADTRRTPSAEIPVSWFYIFNRIISVDEQKELIRFPYMVFRPITSKAYFLQLATLSNPRVLALTNYGGLPTVSYSV